MDWLRSCGISDLELFWELCTVRFRWSHEDTIHNPDNESAQGPPRLLRYLTLYWYLNTPKVPGDPSAHAGGETLFPYAYAPWDTAAMDDRNQTLVAGGMDDCGSRHALNVKPEVGVALLW